MAASMRMSFIYNDLKLNCKFKFKLKFSIFPIKSTIHSNAYRGFSTKEFSPYQYCLESVRKYDYENYLCSLLLSDSVRSAAIVIRAFNAEISQIRDLVSTVSIGQMRIKFWQTTLENTFKGNPPEHPIASELSKVLEKHNLSKAWFHRLISSRESVLNDKPFHTVKELEDYCDNSVVPVFLLILQAFGLANVHCDHVASHIGKSQGICNLLRGIPYNGSKGRLFLPLDLMSKHKISQEKLFRGKQKKNLQDAVYELSSLAHQHLNLGRKLSKDVPKEAKSIFLPAVATAAYLNKLQKTDFDVFHPANQKRNNLIPFSLLFHKLRKKY